MDIFKIFKKQKALIAVDFGSSSLKFIELDLKSSPITLQNLVITPLAAEHFANNTIKNTAAVSEKLAVALDQLGGEDRQAATAIPGPSVFTKRIKINKASGSELAANIQFEAGNLIPHNLDAVKIDYHVLGEVGKNQLEVLVVAAKNEVIESYTNTLSFAGLTPAVVDVDYFALQNCFELAYPELSEEKVALVNVGARYASVNICHRQESLFTGDISVGGRVFTEAVMQELGCTYEQAEDLKKNPHLDPSNEQIIKDVLERKVDFVSGEIARQLSLFWNSTGADGGIDRIFLTGGSSVISGLLRELNQKTSVKCELLEPLRNMAVDENIEAELLKASTSLLAVAVGLALRLPNDKDVLSVT